MTHLWTPWRATYIKEKKRAEGCVFCLAGQVPDDPNELESADRENLVVHRAARTFVILNRYPYTNGHLMIAPYQHVSRLNEAPAETAAEIMHLVRHSEAILQATYQPGGIN